MVSDGHRCVKIIIRNSGKPPTFMLYTDEQLADIRNYCCSDQTALGVDKAFMLTKMHVTVTVYKQLSVSRSANEQLPLFKGPMFIHDTIDYETYCQFFFTT